MPFVAGAEGTLMGAGVPFTGPEEQVEAAVEEGTEAFCKFWKAGCCAAIFARNDKVGMADIVLLAYASDDG